MKLAHEKSMLAIALATCFVAEVQGYITVPFEDKFVNGEVAVDIEKVTYRLLLDTGSSNTWVGAGKPFTPGPNSKDTGKTVLVEYGSGSMSGKEFLDDVTLGSAIIQGQSIGVASSSKGFDGVDGVLGLGQTELTKGTVSGEDIIPTVTDNLFSQGTISENIASIAGGEICFGGVNPEKFKGDITYAPITSTSPASQFWGIDAAFTYGSSGTSLLASTAGIIDHSSTLTLLASGSYSDFLKLTGATQDQTTGLPVMDSCDELEPIFFQIGDVTFEVPVGLYRWPADQNSQIGGDANKCYLAVGDIGTPSGEGLDFTLGYNTMKHFTVVFDTGNQRVGIANAA
ncbi:hypothetical protein O988_08720 [Pseudogymnoascus sp. VKM F-3808]|nr:hypothetical protein O988_08720 [Pseudogymnoascus sp. VKM F-3808]